jgi:hypothetical protein
MASISEQRLRSWSNKLLVLLLQSRVEVWRRFRHDLIEARQTLLRWRGDEIDFHGIGVYFAMLEKIPSMPSQNLTFTEFFRSVAPLRWPFRAVKVIRDFVEPWAERYDLQ